MNVREHLGATLLLVALCAVANTAWSASPALAPTCAITQAPKAAHLLENHVVKLWVYPETIPEGFTGCKKVWWAEGELSGELFGSVKYESGVVVFVEFHEPDSPQPRFCEYAPSGEPSPGNSAKCGPAAGWQ